MCPFICEISPFICEMCPFICEMCPFFNEIRCKVCLFLVIFTNAISCLHYLIYWYSFLKIFKSILVFFFFFLNNNNNNLFAYFSSKIDNTQ